MRIFVLEDNTYRVNFFIEKFCEHDVIVTENAYSAIEYMEKEEFDYIFLDHDLGDGNGCGLDVAEFLYSNPDNRNNNSFIIVHSLNTPAAKRMVSLLSQADHLPFDAGVFAAIEL